VLRGLVDGCSSVPKNVEAIVILLDPKKSVVLEKGMYSMEKVPRYEHDNYTIASRKSSPLALYTIIPP
jgi:hypothetical protein